jgi:GTP-binding protein
MDATHPFETQDLQIADLVEREGRALVFVLAKWDLVEDPQARLKAFVEHAARMLPQVRGAPVVALSAETGRGVERLMPALFKTHADWSTKIKTRDLNDWLQIAIERHPPPAVNGRRIKPKYMAQTKARPPTFVLFASRADQLPDSYRRYLINSMRESFDLPGVPVRLTVKANKNPYADEAGGPPQPSMGHRSSEKAPSRASNRSGAKSASKPALGKPGAKASGKPVGKPAGKAAGKPVGKSFGKPTGKPPLKPKRARPSSR